MSDPITFAGQRAAGHTADEAPLQSVHHRRLPPGGNERAGSSAADASRPDQARALDDAIAEMASMTDETDSLEVWAEFQRGIDEARPDRKLFEGTY